MCGRVAFGGLKGEFRARLRNLALEGEPLTPIGGDITPSQDLLAVRRAKDGLCLERRRWGLIPRWARDSAPWHRTFNARSETAATLPSFREAFRQRRCLIPVTGFYEWSGLPGAKARYLIDHPDDGEMLVFAGLYEDWEGKGGRIPSCTILTTTPNTVMARLHHRMPVVLAPDTWDAWLALATDPGTIQDLLRPCPDEALRIREVPGPLEFVASAGV